MSPRGACIMSEQADTRRAAGRCRTARHLPARVAISFAMAIALTVSGSVHAATVSAVQGQVLVSSGQGYRLVDGSTRLDPGGMVVANPGAVAHVLYPGGCRVTVEPGSVYQIASQAPCQTSEPTQVGGLSDKGDKGSSQPATTSSGMNPWLLGGAALAVGAGVAYYVATLSP
jgi:hypothetical protein